MSTPDEEEVQRFCEEETADASSDELSQEELDEIDEIVNDDEI